MSIYNSIKRIINFTVGLSVVLLMPGLLTMPVVAETIQLENGVEIKELFTIGVDGENVADDDPYLFYDINKVECDSKGNLYVFDFKAHSVKVFDKDGKFHEKFFRSGSGPDEISNAYGMSINKFTDHIYILQDYGYTLKEFDKHGKFVKLHQNPQQFFSTLEFTHKDKCIYRAFNNDNKPSWYLFKVLNVETDKIEREFAKTTEEETHSQKQRFVLFNGLLWAAPGDKMKLRAYDLKNGNKVKDIDIPGNYKKNIYKIKKIQGGEMRRPIFFNVAQPFTISDRLFLLVVLQEYKPENESVEDFPFKSTHFLYLLEGDTLKKLGAIKEYDFMFLDTVWKNRFILQADDPYPRVTVFEMTLR
jgi:hypothetical protein